MKTIKITESDLDKDNYYKEDGIDVTLLLKTARQRGRKVVNGGNSQHYHSKFSAKENCPMGLKSPWTVL